jgi:hypothetical protein
LAIIYSLRDGSDSARDALGRWTSAAAAAAAQFVKTWVERAQTLHRSIVWLLTLVLLIGMSSLMVLLLHRWPYGRSAQRPTARAQQQIVQLYKRMLALSARRGLPITPSTTPTEVVRLVGERWKAAETAVLRLTTLYCRARFSVRSPSSEELIQAGEDIGILRRLARLPD